MSNGIEDNSSLWHEFAGALRGYPAAIDSGDEAPGDRCDNGLHDWLQELGGRCHQLTACCCYFSTRCGLVATVGFVDLCALPG
jgi:hypothetical protein